MKRKVGFYWGAVGDVGFTGFIGTTAFGVDAAGINMLYRAKRQTKALYLAVECLENLRTQHLCTLESTVTDRWLIFLNIFECTGKRAGAKPK